MGKTVRAKRPPAKRPVVMGKDVSVMVWIEDIYGQVLFVKQARGRKLWALPGGKVRRNESLEGALRREVFEETGLTISDCAPIDLFDRNKKASVTLLFRALVKPMRRKLAPRLAKEIASVQFKALLPRNATPSASFFWKRAQSSFDPLSLIT